MAGLVLLLVATASSAAAQESRIVKDIRIEVDGAYLGIEMEDVTAESASTYKLGGERGVIVRSVVKGSPAETAGLQAKDVILEYAGMPVFSAEQMRRLVRETPVGRNVDLVASRDGKKVTLAAKIGKREGPSVISSGQPLGEPGTFSFEGPDGTRAFRFRMDEGRRLPGAPGLGWVQEGPMASRPRLGVTLQPLTDQMAEFFAAPGKKGVLVTSVIEGSAAAGKLKAGDVITGADNQAVAEPEDLTKIVRGKSAGGKLELKVVRDKKETVVVVELPGQAPKAKPKGYAL